jgi:clan AA aspartic protease
MDMVKTEIILKNAYDEGNASEGLIKLEAVRSVTIMAVADTSYIHLVINEDLCQKLGLTYIGERIVHIADGQRIRCKISEAVNVYWKNRHTACSALVIPGAKSVLLGVIPLEGMDLMVNPVTQEVVGIHGDEEEYPCFITQVA